MYLFFHIYLNKGNLLCSLQSNLISISGLKIYENIFHTNLQNTGYKTINLYKDQDVFFSLHLQPNPVFVTNKVKKISICRNTVTNSESEDKQKKKNSHN